MTTMLRILAFDTAMRACSAALWREGEITVQETARMERGQSEALIPMVQRVLQKANLAFSDLDALAVTTGPGAFTGLRIGLAAARGIALAARIPVFGITTLTAFAHGIPAAERHGRVVLVVLDTKRADFYVQMFSDDLSPRGEPTALAPSALTDLINRTNEQASITLAGDAAAAAEKVLRQAGIDPYVSNAGESPDPAVMAGLAAAQWQKGERPAGDPSPFYLRPPDVTQPRPS